MEKFCIDFQFQRNTLYQNIQFQLNRIMFFNIYNFGKFYVVNLIFDMHIK